VAAVRRKRPVVTSSIWPFSNEPENDQCSVGVQSSPKLRVRLGAVPPWPSLFSPWIDSAEENRCRAPSVSVPRLVRVKLVEGSSP
jgi:hypothetical protein